MIITVSREFGSGGREIGMRLAEELGLEYFDKEIVAEIADRCELDEHYVENVLDRGGYKNFSFSFGRSLPMVSAAPDVVTDVLVAQQQVIRALGAKGNCLVVGRCAEELLKQYKPFRIFVYADNESKIARCRARATENENYTDKQLLKKFKEIDKGRKQLHDLVSPNEWGTRSEYELMINTSRADIEKIIAPLAEYIRKFAAN